MRVLVVKTSSMGDIVHTLPALTDATDALDSVKFDWVCEPSFQEIPHWHPAVADVLAIPLRQWRGRLHRLLFSDAFRAYKAALSARPYDAVIDVQGLMKSAFLITRFTEGRRHGYAWASAREPLASFAYHRRYQIARDWHAITRIRHLFAKALGYPIPQSAPDASIDLGPSVSQCPRVVVVTQTSRVNKQWSAEAWHQVIEQAADQFDEVVLPAGTPVEQRAVEQFQGHEAVRIVAGASLTQVAREIAGARAVISVDTGLCHIADALGIPLLALYGPTTPGLVGPIGTQSQVIQSATSDMSQISVDDVIQWLNAIDTASDVSHRGWS
jgi:heptosyltransferase-1